jgi:hypothetical protein
MQKTGKLEAYPTLLPATISAGSTGVGEANKAGACGLPLNDLNSPVY